MSQLMSQLYENGRRVGWWWWEVSRGFQGFLLITTGILTSWHQGNVIPHCLCNPEKLHSKETQSVSQKTQRGASVCAEDKEVQSVQ